MYEKLKHVKILVFDKTGTITCGKPTVKKYTGDQKGLLYAASIERLSAHPIAKAIVTYAKEKGVEEFLEVINFKEIPGKGVIGNINNNVVEVKRDASGNVTVYIDNEYVGSFDIEDDIRPYVKEYIKELKEMGLRVILLSGDKEDKTRKIAHKIGINEYYANASPDDKVKIIKELKETGESIMMVGDGVNDAAALAIADVSVVMGSGVDVSKNISDIILISNDIGILVKLIRNRKKLSKGGPLNVLIALSYNAIGIPLAILGLLTMQIAMLIMALSLISVFLNANIFKKMINL